MKNKTRLMLGLLASLTLPALADISALVAIEPTARKDGYLISRNALEAGLAKALAEDVAVTSTEDLSDAMRSTRSAGFDIFIGPAQVVASALGHGYELIGSTDPEENYMLVGRAGVTGVAGLRGGRLYLPQQDSIYTYMARGVLTAAGLSFKDLQGVNYARYPQAGLTAIAIRSADATMVRRDDWELWQKDNPGVASVLATSGAVPGGFSAAVRRTLPAAQREALAKWFGAAVRGTGLKPMTQHAAPERYKAVAALGTFTPGSLPGATLVTADDVRRLMAQGALLVDTRIESEYRDRHITGARWVPYQEKSLKDVAYDATLDNFSGVKALNPKTPTIFQCNGPECWKSYKACRTAIGLGFSKVYWYRGGMPDWEAAGLPTSRE